VQTDPPAARVRIVNIKPKYEPGIKLTPGHYHIEVTAPGYQMKREWVTVDATDRVVTMALTKEEQREHRSVDANHIVSEFRHYSSGTAKTVKFSLSCPVVSPDDGKRYQREYTIESWKFTCADSRVCRDRRMDHIFYWAKMEWEDYSVTENGFVLYETPVGEVWHECLVEREVKQRGADWKKSWRGGNRGPLAVIARRSTDERSSVYISFPGVSRIPFG
jgi:hypothetical protein